MAISVQISRHLPTQFANSPTENKQAIPTHSVSRPVGKHPVTLRVTLALPPDMAAASRRTNKSTEKGQP